MLLWNLHQLVRGESPLRFHDVTMGPWMSCRYFLWDVLCLKDISCMWGIVQYRMIGNIFKKPLHVAVYAVSCSFNEDLELILRTRNLKRIVKPIAEFWTSVKELKELKHKLKFLGSLNFIFDKQICYLVF